jgi:hypothetical protein
MLRHARSGLFKKLDAEAIQEFSSHGIEMYENAMRSSGELVVKATLHPQNAPGDGEGDDRARDGRARRDRQADGEGDRCIRQARVRRQAVSTSAPTRQ